MVGRQIVDRAKIQRIIFEFDYYEKAFHQFYDTYRVVPGNLDYKTCIKHAEFSGEACTDPAVCNGRAKGNANLTNEQWCNHTTLATGTARKVINTYGLGLWWSAIQLKKSGYISQDVFPFFSYSNRVNCSRAAGICTYSRKFSVNLLSNVDKKGGSYKVNAGHYANVSFDKNIQIGFMGYLNTDTILPGQEYYAKQTVGHNIIVFQYLLMRENPRNHINEYTDLKYGALNAKLMSELDAKIDDGRPGTGKLLASKSTFELDATATEEQKAKICYDNTIEHLDKAIYVSDTNQKYGCNIIKVMEDVK